MLSIFVIISITTCCLAFETDLTVEVGPGRMECFYQEIKKETEFEIEYQVIDGGDLDINFFVQAPDGKVLISEHKKTDNMHKVDAKIVGDYKVCLDNTFSHFANKLVFFELLSDEEEGDDDLDSWDGAKEELEEIMDMKLEDFKTMMDRMKENLDKANGMQNMIKVYEARDRNTVEANFDRVNFFSAFQLIAMLVVGATQVIMIRSLFDDKSKLYGMMKTRT